MYLFKINSKLNSSNTTACSHCSSGPGLISCNVTDCTCQDGYITDSTDIGCNACADGYFGYDPSDPDNTECQCINEIQINLMKFVLNNKSHIYFSM